MSALDVDRNTPERDGKSYSYPMAASKEIFAGSIVFLDTLGNAEPASTATGKICAGMAAEYMDNSGGQAADKSITCKSGCFRFGNGETITKAHIGDLAYALDDQTLYRTGSGKSPVGAIVDVDAGGVWVKIEAPLAAATTGLLAANNLNDVGSVATARSSLGLDTANNVQFNNIDADGTLGVDGAATFDGAVSIAGVANYTNLTRVTTASGTVVFASDGDALIQDLTDTGVVTLPDITAGSKGFRVTVQNTAAVGASKISVSPHSSDTIAGNCFSTGSTSTTLAGDADDDLINTKATALKGDFVTLVSDGTSTWWVTASKGIWVSEA